jgi:hypothetical protein
MRALSIFLAAAALLTTVSTAQADDAGSAKPRRATAQQMDQVTGAYKLSDGRRAEIFALGERLYVRVGRGPQTELELAGMDRFASTDGRMSIQFGPGLDTDRIVLGQAPVVVRNDTIQLASNERAGRASEN